MNGLEELQALAADLLREGENIRPRVEKAVGRSTDALYQLAQSTVPVDTGELRESIQKDTKGLSRRVYSNEIQGFFQEYGTVHHPPQPWLMVHFDSAEKRFVRELIEELWDGR
jgi:hypothetical protein